MRKLIALLIATILPTQGALTFGSANTNKTNCGSGASLDDIEAGTIAVWYRPAVVNTYKAIISKADNSYTAYTLFATGNTGAIRIQRKRATTTLDAISSASVLSANTWHYIAATWDTAAGTPAVYRGTLTTSISDVTTGSPTRGSGTPASDAANDLLIGNETPSASLSSNGRIATVQIWNRVLTLAELQSQQFRPRVTSGTVLHWIGTTTSNHSDYSGLAHACTVTGASVGDHVPIGPYFGFDWRDATRRLLGLYA